MRGIERMRELLKGHDVSDEPRDHSGRWTKEGLDSHPALAPHVAAKESGDVVAGRRYTRIAAELRDGRDRNREPEVANLQRTGDGEYRTRIDGCPVDVVRHVQGRHPVYHSYSNQPEWHVYARDGRSYHKTGMGEEGRDITWGSPGASRNEAIANAARSLAEHRKHHFEPARRTEEGRLIVPEEVREAHDRFARAQGSRMTRDRATQRPDTATYHDLLEAMHKHNMPWRETLETLGAAWAIEQHDKRRADKETRERYGRLAAGRRHARDEKERES